MKKIVLLFSAFCCFATVSWGQKDTIRPGEGPYDWPYIPTEFGTMSEIGTCNDVPVVVHYVAEHPKTNIIYGIGVVASASSMKANWGVKLYSSALYDSNFSDNTVYIRDSARCERMVSYTATTPYNYFQMNVVAILGSHTAQPPYTYIRADTTVCIYDFYFESPYYADYGENLYMAYYDSLYDVADTVHPIVYAAGLDTILTISVGADRVPGRQEHFNRSCDSLPYLVFVSPWRNNVFLGIFPITTPPTQQMDTVPECDAVAENLRLVRQGDRRVVVAWDTIGRAAYYQLRWGRYTVDSLTSEVSLQDGRIVNTYADTAVLNVVDTGWFACRVRAVCEHECYYHDETDYSDWSDTLYFYMAPPPLPPDTTAIVQTAATLQVRIAPNPVQGTLTVNTEQEDSYTIEVYNDMGVRLLIEKFTGMQHRLDVSRQPKGHYILAVATKQATTRLAFVKQ